MMEMNLDKMFEYENGFYLTAPVDRISKFVTHLELFKKVTDLPGEIVECGVFKGNSLCRFIKFRALLENHYSRRVIAFDTFGEFPETNFEADKIRRSEFIEEAGNLSITRKNLISVLEQLDLYHNIDLIEGDILETIPDYVNRFPYLKISLLHIDVDIYEPTRTSLELLYPLVVRGGIVILDDYGAFPGANKAIDDYFEHTDIRVKKLPYTNAISFIEKP